MVVFLAPCFKDLGSLEDFFELGEVLLFMFLFLDAGPFLTDPTGAATGGGALAPQAPRLVAGFDGGAAANVGKSWVEPSSRDRCVVLFCL